LIVFRALVILGEKQEELWPMPSLMEMRLVGQTCSAYEAQAEDVERSCDSCQHWKGEEEMCELDIFWDQLTSLDQT
jgi:hypothetical protein